MLGERRGFRHEDEAEGAVYVGESEEPAELRAIAGAQLVKRNGFEAGLQEAEGGVGGVVIAGVGLIEANGDDFRVVILNVANERSEYLIGKILAALEIVSALVVRGVVTKDARVPGERILQHNTLCQGVGAGGVVLLEAFEQVAREFFEAAGGIGEINVEEFGGIWRSDWWRRGLHWVLRQGCMKREGEEQADERRGEQFEWREHAV